MSSTWAQSFALGGQASQRWLAEAERYACLPNQGKAVSFFGEDAQSLVHCEEMGELIQAVSKMRRARNAGADDTQAYYNLVEEIADVLISITQMTQMYNIPDHEIQRMVDKKCLRLEAKINGTA